MNTQRPLGFSWKILAVPVVLLAATGCGDDSSGDTTGEPSRGGGGGAAGSHAESGAGGAGDGSAGALYAIMYEVYDDADSVSYLSILDSLEIDAVDTSTAREYGSGRAFIQAYDGHLFVGDAEAPTVTRYAVSETGELEPRGALSFANYGLSEGQFDTWNVSFISKDKAYLMNFTEGTTIIWNPTTMEILGEIPGPPELVREGWSLEGSPGALRDGKLYRTFDWANYVDGKWSTDFLLAVYDVETDQIVSMVEETRCPVPGNLVHQDEKGTIYFSNWIWPVAATILRDAPDPCVLRINPGEDGFDPEWTLRYQDVTDGRHGAMFSYLQGNRALVSAFYDERTSFDAETDPWAYVGSNNWRIWDVDLEAMTGSPVEGIDFNGGAFTPVQFDGHLFVMVPGGEEDGYATQLYEIEDGRATPHVKLPGWSYQFVKLR